MTFHNLTIPQVLTHTVSFAQGLTTLIADEKLLEFGRNELEEKKKRPPWVLFVYQFKDFMILILIAAAVVSGVAGDIADAIIILAIVLLNAIIGFVQEYRADKAMDALKKMATVQAHVMRDGKSVIIPSGQLVPGDLVLLEAGNAVPADLRLTETYNLRIDESALTGESVAVDKSEHILPDAGLAIGDRLNMAYKTTLVTAGRAKGIVTSTGMNTEIGGIARLLQDEEAITPLQKRMADFSKKLSYGILLICILLFCAGLIRGEEPLTMLLLSISLAVAAIPEALPALITIALAQGARRLVKKNALIRKLYAVETLGSVSFICTDKTGTLTENKMKVIQVDAAPTDTHLFKTATLLECAMALNNDVKEGADKTLIGDPTETALVDYFISKHSNDELIQLLDNMPRERELSFDSVRKCMTTVHKHNDKFLVVSKGAVETISGNLVQPNNSADILIKTNELAANGMRVLAFAYKIVDVLPETFTVETIENELMFAGLVGMIDPPRKEAKLAIQECKNAGVNVVMITGDHPVTASAIAKQIGILKEKDVMLTGKELQSLSDEAFEEKVESVSVYARVSPEQKLDIVKALQHRNHFVSMTGDGVNDAPALRQANIGVAMGINGTDVSKEAAHMILLDDNFTTIVKAVKEGRRIYDNIRKFVKYIMTCNGAEIWTIFLASLIGLPIPLLPIHILWINLVTDGLPGLALSSEKAEKDIMKRPPRKWDESLFADGTGVHIIWVGMLMAGVTLGIQAWAIANNAPWQTMVFTVLSLTQLGHILAIRTERDFLYKAGLLSNVPLLLTVLLTSILQLGVIYLPFANTLFKTQPLTLSELLICIGASAIVFHAVELEKWIKEQKRKNVRCHY